MTRWRHTCKSDRQKRTFWTLTCNFGARSTDFTSKYHVLTSIFVISYSYIVISTDFDISRSVLIEPHHRDDQTHLVLWLSIYPSKVFYWSQTDEFWLAPAIPGPPLIFHLKNRINQNWAFFILKIFLGGFQFCRILAVAAGQVCYECVRSVGARLWANLSMVWMY